MIYNKKVGKGSTHGDCVGGDDGSPVLWKGPELRQRRPTIQVPPCGEHSANEVLWGTGQFLIPRKENHLDKQLHMEMPELQL